MCVRCAEYACHHLKNNLMSYMRQVTHTHRRTRTKNGWADVSLCAVHVIVAAFQLKKGGDECEWLKKCLRKAFQQTDNNWLHIAKKQNIDAGQNATLTHTHRSEGKGSTQTGQLAVWSLAAGCTALVCLLYGPDEKGELRLVTAHAGGQHPQNTTQRIVCVSVCTHSFIHSFIHSDTRAVMVRGGAAKALTRDHKPNDKKEKARTGRERDRQTEIHTHA